MNPQAPTNNNAASVAPDTAPIQLAKQSIHIVSAPAGAVNTFISRARILTERGIPVLPVNAGEKRCTLSGWPALATTDEAQIEAWAQQYPNANTAAVCLSDGACVVDADVAGLMSRIEQECGKKVPPTLVVKSGGKGLPHVYFKHTTRSTALGNLKAAGLFDFQANRKYVVGPGSVLAGGGEYQIVVDAPLAPIPDWLCDWLEQYGTAEKSATKSTDTPVHPDFDFEAFLEHYGIAVARKRGDWHITDPCPIGGMNHGGTHETGFFYDGRSLGWKCFDTDCLGSNMTVGQVIAHLNKGEGLRVVKPYDGPIWSKAAEAPRAFKQTDGGNAERLVAGHKDDFRYLSDKQVWLSWDGRRWNRDASDEIHRAAKATVRSMYAQAAAIENETERKDFVRWARLSDSRKARENMVALARYEPEMSAKSEDFDQDIMLLNCLNGTIDLRTGTLRQHDRSDRLTQIIPVKFDSAAKCPRFLQFLKETFEGKPELIDFLQRSVGYGLTGSIAEQCFWLLIGAGNNGKSVLLRTLGHLLGDYAVETSFDTFAAKRTTTPVSPRDGLASLKGSRFVHASESDQGRKFSEAQLKALTGGEKVRTAKMYEEDFAYQPTFKIWLSTNHDPTITGTDDGIWRRIHRVNFDNQVPEDRKDRNLDVKLQAEASGILNWVLAGLEQYRRDGLRVPTAVTSATKEYRYDQNPVRDFLDECCDTGDAAAQVEAAKLLDQYNMWSKIKRKAPISSNAFGMAMKSLGYVAPRTMQAGKRGRWYSGIALNGNRELTVGGVPVKVGW
jgi:P4 family phage/plasmid primase-like protien